jgi:hypothetical protein
MTEQQKEYGEKWRAEQDQIAKRHAADQAAIDVKIAAVQIEIDRERDGRIMAKAFIFETAVEIPVSVTVQWQHEVKTTKHVEGYRGHYEVLEIELPRNIKDYIIANNYQSFCEEAEGME